MDNKQNILLLEQLNISEIYAVNRVNRPIGSYIISNRSYCALCYKASGHTVYTQNKIDYISDKDHIIFIPQGAYYKYNCQELGECTIVEFSAKNCGSVLASYCINNAPEILALLSRIEHIYTLKKTGYRNYCLGTVYRLLYSVETAQENHHLVNYKRKKIQKGLDYLEDHYNDENLQISVLCRINDMSEIYFRKLFTDAMGLSPKQYLNLLRIRKAKELLLSKEIKLEQIATAVGFKDCFNFSKAFKKAEACTPSEYRKKH